MRALALVLAPIAVAAALTVAAVRGPQAPQTVDDRVHALASTLRCPVCLNLSVADSPSPVAQQMRARIREDLQAGKTPDQIRAEFIAAYGDWILLSPPRRGLNLLVWALPPVLLLAGLPAAVLIVRRWTMAGPQSAGRANQPAAVAALSPRERELLERELARAEDVGE